MRIFLSALESTISDTLDRCIKEHITIPFGLVSYYYISQSEQNYKNFQKVLKICDQVLVDSGAHSFQEGKKVPWDEYTEQYAEFIKQHDNPKIIGWFEMDVDRVIGYEHVLKLRKVLTKATDKIIPVWHKNRGIDEFKRMCRETKGEIVAVTGFKNEDIQDDQYAPFLKYAWKCGKKLHCLGMTRQKVMDRVPFDYVDSSSWKLSATFGSLKSWSEREHKLKNVPNTKGKFTTKQLFYKNLMEYVKMVRHYNIKWQKINNDLYFKLGVRNFLHKIKLRVGIKEWISQKAEQILLVSQEQVF